MFSVAAAAGGGGESSTRATAAICGRPITARKNGPIARFMPTCLYLCNLKCFALERGKLSHGSMLLNIRKELFANFGYSEQRLNSQEKCSPPGDRPTAHLASSRKRKHPVPGELERPVLRQYAACFRPSKKRSATVCHIFNLLIRFYD